MAMTPIFYFLYFGKLFFIDFRLFFQLDGAAQSDIHFTTSQSLALRSPFVRASAALLFASRL
jgi:hypothetical protein